MSSDTATVPGANRVAGTAGYGAHAVDLVGQYESLSFEDVHHDVIHLFPVTSCRVLDVGAGSGRDAAALMRCGHSVFAVEPTAELRGAGQRLHAGLAIEWLDDHLPTLDLVRRTGHRFDLILLTAVWMHLDEQERETAMMTLAELLAEGGRLAMSLRHGPVPEGRRMFDVSAEATIALAARNGLTAVHCSTRGDMLGRADVGWSNVVLQRSPDQALTP